jgi:hypothetical protein
VGSRSNASPGRACADPLGGEELVADADVYVRTAFEHVADPSAWEEEPPARQPADGEDAHVPIEQRDRDVEPHAERVDRARAIEQ